MTPPCRSEVKRHVQEFIRCMNETQLARLASDDAAVRLHRATRDQEVASDALVTLMTIGQGFRLGGACVVCRRNPTGGPAIELTYVESLDS